MNNPQPTSVEDEPDLLLDLAATSLRPDAATYSPFERLEMEPDAEAPAPAAVGTRRRPVLKTPVPWPRMISAALLLAAVILWLLSLRHVRLDEMGDYGLISVLPVTFWVSLGLLTLGFAVTVRQRSVRNGQPLLYVLALITVLHATPTLLYGTLRYSWAWKHVAIIDYLLRHGGTDPSNGPLSAYNQWPGFFAYNAVLLRMAGLNSALSYAAWAPPVFNALMIAPLFLIFRTLTRDRRVAWGAIWLFSCCEWTGQDYFSPQAFAFILFLAVLGIVLNRRNRAAARTRPPTLPAPSGPSRTSVAVWVLLLVPVIAAIGSSHQLTPLMLVLALAVLAFSRQRGPVLLWTLGASVAFMLAWDGTVGLSFIRSNLASIVDSFGSLDANATGPLAGAATASSQQQVIAYVDTGAAVFVALLALAAVLLRKELRRSSAFLLALAPLPLLAANNYGGEIIFRVYLFALPGAAFLAAMLILGPRRARRLQAIAFLLVSALTLAGFVMPYYGKEAENYFSPAEVAATYFMYQTAPHGSMIVGATGDYPGGSLDYEYYNQVSWLEGLTAQDRLAIEHDPVHALQDLLSTSATPAYFILTKSQEAEISIEGLVPPATLKLIEQIPGTAPQFTVIYRNADAVVLELTPSSVTGPQPPLSVKKGVTP